MLSRHISGVTREDGGGGGGRGGVRVYGITVIAIFQSGISGFQSKSARFSVKCKFY